MNVKRENDRYIIQTDDYTVVVKNNLKFNLYKLAHDIDGDNLAGPYQNYYDISLRDALTLTNDDKKLNELCFTIYDNIMKSHAEEQYETHVSTLEQQINQQAIQQMYNDMEQHEKPQENEADAELIRDLIDQIELLTEQTKADFERNSELAEANEILKAQLSATEADNINLNADVARKNTEIANKDITIDDQNKQLQKFVDVKINTDVDGIIELHRAINNFITISSPYVTNKYEKLMDMIKNLIKDAPYVLVVHKKEIYKSIRKIYTTITNDESIQSYKDGMLLSDMNKAINKMITNIQQFLDGDLCKPEKRADVLTKITGKFDRDYKELIATIKILTVKELKIERLPLLFIKYLHDFINPGKLHEDTTFTSINIAHRWKEFKDARKIMHENKEFIIYTKPNKKTPGTLKGESTYCRFNLLNNYYYGQKLVENAIPCTTGIATKYVILNTHTRYNAPKEISPVEQLFQLPDINMNDIANANLNNIPSTYIRTFNKYVTRDQTHTLAIWDTIKQLIPAMDTYDKSRLVKQFNEWIYASRGTQLHTELNSLIDEIKKSEYGIFQNNMDKPQIGKTYDMIVTLNFIYNKLFKSLELYACLANDDPALHDAIINYIINGLDYLATCILLIDISLLHIKGSAEFNDVDKINSIYRVIVYFTLFSATVMKKIKDTAGIKDKDIHCSNFLNGMFAIFDDNNAFTLDMTRLAVYVIYYMTFAEEDSISINGMTLNNKGTSINIRINNFIRNINTICTGANDSDIKKHFGIALRSPDGKSYANIMKTLVTNSKFNKIIKELCAPGNELIKPLGGGYKEKLHGGFEFQMSDKAKYILKIIAAVIFILALIAIIVYSIVSYRNKHIEEQYTVRFIK